MHARTTRHWAHVLLIAGAAIAAGCGGGYGGYSEVVVPVGEVEVDNQTDLVPPLADVTYFEMLPVGGIEWTGDLLVADVFPGETQYLGTFYEDYYDAFAELDLGLSGAVEFFDVFVAGGFVTTFEVF